MNAHATAAPIRIVQRTGSGNAATELPAAASTAPTMNTKGSICHTSPELSDATVTIAEAVRNTAISGAATTRTPHTARRE